VNIPGEDVPGYQTIRVGAVEAPVAALADLEAWQAHEEFPDIRFSGPVFGVARERSHGGWELHPYFGALAPQAARDSMGSHFRKLAHEAEQSGDQAGRAECLRAAEAMDRTALDEVRVLGTRYRVVRADRFVRSGPAGPEPPRPSDPDPGEPGLAGEVPDPVAGFVIDPVTVTGMSEGILKLELLDAIYPEGVVPAGVRGDCLAAARTHPGGVLLPVAFTVAELAGGRWRAAQAGTSATPQGARDRLAGYLRVMAPWELGLDETERGVYAAAAGQLDAGRGNELAVAGRRFQVVRVERLIRIGPDGPEGPRPSDPDPEPPVMAQTQQSRQQGGQASGDEDTPIELDEDAQRFARLFQEEEQQRQARLRNQAPPRSA